MQHLNIYCKPKSNQIESNQLLDVIEWKDESKDTIVYRYETDKREEIMTSSTLVVRESQVAVFVHKGVICDVFELFLLQQQLIILK